MRKIFVALAIVSLTMAASMAMAATTPIDTGPDNVQVMIPMVVQIEQSDTSNYSIGPQGTETIPTIGDAREVVAPDGTSVGGEQCLRHGDKARASGAPTKTEVQTNVDSGVL